MIRTEKEYKAALQKLRQNEEALNKQREHLEAMQLSEEQVILALSPIESFYHQLKHEIETFERIKNQS